MENGGRIRDAQAEQERSEEKQKSAPLKPLRCATAPGGSKGAPPASERVDSLRGTGSMTMRPDSSRTSTRSSKPSFAARRIAVGISNEALLAHLLTTVCNEVIGSLENS